MFFEPLTVAFTTNKDKVFIFSFFFLICKYLEVEIRFDTEHFLEEREFETFVDFLHLNPKHKN